MSDVAYITNAAATLTFTAGSKTVTVTGTNPILEGVLRGDRAVDPGGVELAIDVVAAGTLTLLRNAPTSGTVQFDVAPVSRLRTSLAANAEVTREVYAKLLAAVEDNRSIPVISMATAPPGSPADGDRHLVIATATGAFAGKEGYIAQYDAANTRWIFIAPIAGMKVTVDGSAVLRIYTGAAWTVSGATAASEIAFTPTGGVAATTVQAAIAEVDSEKVSKASGTTAGRLWRFTDTAGGLGQSQMSEDASGAILFPNTPTLASFTGTSAGAILIRGGSGTGEFNTISFATTGGNVAARIGAAIGGSGSSLHFGISNNYGSGITHNVMTVRYDQRVGINTTAPAAPLDIRGPAGSTVLQVSDGTYGTFGLSFSATYGIEFGSAAGSPINFKSNNVLGMTINTSGQVGIGPGVLGRSPAYALDVHDSNATVFRMRGGSTDVCAFSWRADNGGTPVDVQAGLTKATHSWGAGIYWYFNTGLGLASFLRQSDGSFAVGTSLPNGLALTRTITLGDGTAANWVGYEIQTGATTRSAFYGNNAYAVLATYGAIPIVLKYNNADRVVIGSASVDIAVAHALAQAALTLSNGANQNAAKPASSSLRVTGPTVAFNIGGLTGGTDGMLCELVNTTAHQMTLNNEDASSTAGNRITTDTGGNLNCKHAVLRYDATASRWRVISFRT